MPWYTQSDEYPKWTLNLGVSSSTDTIETGTMSIIANPNLSAINTYSSTAYILSSNKPYNNVFLVASLSSVNTGVLFSTSNTFDILPKTGKYVFFKNNEYVNYGGIIKGNILQENINQHNRLNDMIDAIFGTNTDLPEAIGKILYEKVSNFVSNNADLDTCNINAFYSLAKEVNYDIENYNLSYPGGVGRLVDTLSVGIRKLVGDRNKYYDDFTDETIFTSNEPARYGRNLGTDLLSTDSYMVTAGIPIIVKELYNSNIFKVVPMYISGNSTDSHYTDFNNLKGLSSYPLSTYSNEWNWGLTYPSDGKFYDYYEFYNYIDNNTFPLTSFSQTHGLIDWENTNKIATTYSTLTETTTSYDAWYTKDGIIDTALEYSIRNGLGVIDD
jgi:hypothetical protein